MELAVPYLRYGPGETPADGGCIMQIIDWIDRGKWTDEPVCVHPFIQRLAISINDQAEDKARQKLLDLVPRLMGTSVGVNSMELAQAACLYLATASGKERSFTKSSNVLVARAMVDGTPLIKLLEAVLDEYDRLTGRTKQTEPLDFSGVCQVMSAA